MRYQLVCYRFTTCLPNGTWISRIRCPHCGDLHDDIEQHEERLCFGCGNILYVEGLDLHATEVTEQQQSGEEDCNNGEDPDYPGFWYDMLN
jgi:hypothetical protein